MRSFICVLDVAYFCLRNIIGSIDVIEGIKSILVHREPFVLKVYLLFIKCICGWFHFSDRFVGGASRSQCKIWLQCVSWRTFFRSDGGWCRSTKTVGPTRSSACWTTGYRHWSSHFTSSGKFHWVVMYFYYFNRPYQTSFVLNVKVRSYLRLIFGRLEECQVCVHLRQARTWIFNLLVGNSRS